MDVLANPAVREKRGEAYRQLATMLDPGTHLETMTAAPLPPIPFDQHQSLLQMNQEEHMTMMMMSSVEQIRFMGMSSKDRMRKMEQMMHNMQHQEHR